MSFRLEACARSVPSISCLARVDSVRSVARDRRGEYLSYTVLSNESLQSKKYLRRLKKIYTRYQIWVLRKARLMLSDADGAQAAPAGACLARKLEDMDVLKKYLPVILAARDVFSSVIAEMLNISAPLAIERSDALASAGQRMSARHLRANTEVLFDVCLLQRCSLRTYLPSLSGTREWSMK